MLFTVDIGNTTVSLGVFQGTRLLAVGQILTAANPKLIERSLTAWLRRTKREHPAWKKGFDEAIICSVVPDAVTPVKETIKKELRLMARVVGRDVRVGMPNLYHNPRQVGQDRLVGAYAVMSLYGAPAIVIDLGTAITVDVVSSQKEYMGGIIVPGIRLSIESLFKKTALLPRVEVERPRQLIGRNTKGSILSGIFYGYGEMLSGLVNLISRDLRKKPKIIITGGYTQLMRRYLRVRVHAIERHLVLKGLLLLSKRQKLASKKNS